MIDFGNYEARTNTQPSVTGIRGIQPIAYQLQTLQGFPTCLGLTNLTSTWSPSYMYLWIYSNLQVVCLSSSETASYRAVPTRHYQLHGFPT